MVLFIVKSLAVFVFLLLVASQVKCFALSLHSDDIFVGYYHKVLPPSKILSVSPDGKPISGPGMS